MIKFIALALLLLASLTVDAQDTAIVRQQATIHTEALLKKDYETYARYVHPKLYQLTGGKEKMIIAIKQVLANTEKQGVGMRSSSLGPVGKFYSAGKEIFCVIPYEVIMDSKDGYVSVASSIMGISADQGKNWKFLSSGNIPRETIKKLFPNLPEELEIKPKEKPVLHLD